MQEMHDFFKSIVKCITFALIIFVNTFSVEGHNAGKLTIRGQFPGSYFDGLKLYVNHIDYYDTNDVIKIDSTLVVEDRFMIEMNIQDSITLGYLTVEGMPYETAVFVLEKGNIFIDFDEIPLMSGTPKNNELSYFTKKQLQDRQNVNDLLKEIQGIHKSGKLNKTLSAKYETAIDSIRQGMNKDIFDFIYKNINNEVGQFFFTIYASHLEPHLLDTIYLNAPEKFKKASLIRSTMKKQVWDLGNLRLGREFENIELKDFRAELVDLNSIIKNKNNKVVLIDFWASWCKPCLKSVPYLRHLYENYKDKGFEIISISLDYNETKWKGAISKFDMPWPQLIDERGGFDSLVAKQYRLTKIPQTYLLNADGHIIGVDLKKRSLRNKIEEFLNDEIYNED